MLSETAALTLLLVLQCGILVALADESQYMSTDSLPVVGTIIHRGSSLRIFDLEGFQVAEPRITFGETCDSLKYSYLYQKYQLTFPVNIEVNVLKSATENSRKVGHVTITELLVKADDALASQDSRLVVTTKLRKSSGQGELVFLCDTYLRCQQLRDDVRSNPGDLQDAVRFVTHGRVSGLYVKFGAISSWNPPSFSCPQGEWVVFQRRVDGNLSFAQTWDAYVKGFGNPDTNYWMGELGGFGNPVTNYAGSLPSHSKTSSFLCFQGLDKLSAMTATTSKNSFAGTARCRLRVETQDWRLNHYWGEYSLFEVLGSAQNYRLRVGEEVAGSQLINFLTAHNECPFSTFDRDNDAWSSGSCSQTHGHGGWWYKECHAVNLNGAYTTDKTLENAPEYDTVYRGNYIPMKSSLMKFRCH